MKQLFFQSLEQRTQCHLYKALYSYISICMIYIDYTNSIFNFSQFKYTFQMFKYIFFPRQNVSQGLTQSSVGIKKLFIYLQSTVQKQRLFSLLSSFLNSLFSVGFPQFNLGRICVIRKHKISVKNPFKGHFLQGICI